MDNHEEDAELQAAIALSLGLMVPNPNNNRDNYLITTTNNNTTNHTNSTTPATTPIPMELDEVDEEQNRKLPAQNLFSIPKLPPPPCLPNPQHCSGRVRRWYSSSSSCCNVTDIHNILWDTSIATLLQDQQRWVSQGIQFKDGGFGRKNNHHGNNDSNNNNNDDDGTKMMTVNSTTTMGQNNNHTSLSSSWTTTTTTTTTRMSLLWRTVLTNRHGTYK
jgi:hypothetical protein